MGLGVQVRGEALDEALGPILSTEKNLKINITENRREISHQLPSGRVVTRMCKS
jgi:hypothetical protein